jgi:hypothetical protein
LIFIDEPDFAIRTAMGRFSWNVEKALNITEIAVPAKAGAL